MLDLRGVVALVIVALIDHLGVQRQQGVDGLDLDSVPRPSDAGGHLPGFGVQHGPGGPRGREMSGSSDSVQLTNQTLFRFPDPQ